MEDDFLSVWKIPKYRRRILWLVILLSALFYFFLSDGLKKIYYQTFYGKAVQDSSYTDYMEEPSQESLMKPRAYNMSRDDMELTLNALAPYKIYAMVADKIDHTKEVEETKPKDGEAKDYTSQIAPFDLLLAWGPFAKKDFLERYEFKIVKGKAAPQKDIPENEDAFRQAKQLSPQHPKRYFSENHIIPANNTVYKVLEAVQPYNTVYLEGYLVSYEGKETDKSGTQTPFERTSSLTRNDEGPDAAEIIYVYKVILDGYEYK